MLLAEKLANWTSKIKYADLTDEAIHECKRRFIDSLGTALGAYKSKPATIARQTAAALQVKKGGAVVLGTKHRTTPDLAAFANGAHIRYLDYNDTYLSKEPAHPSDNIAATLAVAQAAEIAAVLKQIDGGRHEPVIDFTTVNVGGGSQPLYPILRGDFGR